MPKKRVNDLVKAWLDGEYTMFDACTEEPEDAWLAILQIVRCELTEEQVSLLAGGPLETLLTWHGSKFIARIESEAKENPKFNYLLGGVWRQEMPDEIWDRIRKVRKAVW
ncbi:MAG TPA: hypothetical protein VGY98_04420 [Verrucomicrobiae bacterium]|nr:hypothetical protein [Verrucomicrobiae bacterium]